MIMLCSECFSTTVIHNYIGRYYTIEHIMPKTLTNQWISMLGENYKVIHEKYLHTIGNLTLTKYNSEMSNKPFPVKKDYIVKNSALRLNYDLKNNKILTAEDLLCNKESKAKIIFNSDPEQLVKQVLEELDKRS